MTHPMGSRREGLDEMVGWRGCTGVYMLPSCIHAFVFVKPAAPLRDFHVLGAGERLSRIKFK